MITINIEEYDGPTEDSYVDLDRQGNWTMQVMVARDEWTTALPPSDWIEKCEYLHLDRIEARIFERMGKILVYNFRGIRVVNVTERGIHLWLPMDYHQERLGVAGAGETFTPSDRGLRALTEAKDRAVAEERDAIREWMYPPWRPANALSGTPRPRT
ncbi:hypothetical protein [Rhodococcus qingshengii]|uniref:hypothetical protein n=1 Tax=Rhodococcus qingshengii TaxID=334542 RepID=UPI002AFFA545|nr:hypothetical protein [Rhodococcus qingshengii]MEA1798682.1 hypothetical protein [Rhodococcus qingshengii]